MRALSCASTWMSTWAPTAGQGRKLLLTTGSIALIASMAAGCASAPDRYYTLVSAMDAATLPPVAAVPAGAPLLYIELAPIDLPERLARPQLVVRRQDAGSSARIDILEQHRWTSSFENELRDALASGIASRLGAIDSTKGSKSVGQPVWRIGVQVRQFDAVENSRVDADFGWTLKRSDRERGVTCRWTVSEPVGAASGIDGVAQAVQRVSAKAAEAIGQDVRAQERNAGAVCGPGI